jgi:hypothetical protein
MKPTFTFQIPTNWGFQLAAPQLISVFCVQYGNVAQRRAP